jgi:hypothetical protein
LRFIVSSDQKEQQPSSVCLYDSIEATIRIVTVAVIIIIIKAEKQ